jgi:predicted O-methyltransferase YrrM
MKAMLSSILPHFALRTLATSRQRARLGKLPSRPFESKSLRRVEKRDLDRIFADTSMRDAWNRDSKLLVRAAAENASHSTDYGERRAIYYLVAAQRPSKVLEVGTNRGMSTLVIAQALAMHVGRKARVLTLDIFDVNDVPNGESPKRYLERLALSDMVTFGIEPSLGFLERTGERFDLIFLDGDHAATAVYAEVSAALRCLNDGGVILLHDYHPRNRHVFRSGMPAPGPFLAIRRIQSEGHAIKVLPFGELPWTTRDGQENVSCLAILTRP